MNWYVLLAALIGLALSWLSRFGIAELVTRVKANIPVPVPSESLQSAWKELTTDPGSDKSGAWLGDLERTLLFLSFWFSAYEVVAAWFAFKVAAKWEAWSNTGALPPSLPDVDDVRYLISRRCWASQRLMSFLVGTLANVLAAYVSMLAAKHAMLPFLQWCFS
ncbi:hypothetical protein [Azotobacter chroococcum]|uniref:hypothetical protein n=1 Tax=Azotobacter chroococcum TaxID=353 RepID=UPI000585851E|nr:hypothetical protein [Azotobacter chroococcum]